MKGREEAEREERGGGAAGAALNLTSRPPSQPTSNINDIDTEVSHTVSHIVRLRQVLLRVASMHGKSLL